MLETVRAAQKLHGAPTIGGGVPGQGVVVEEIKGVKYAPMPLKYTKQQKYRQFRAHLAYKSLKTSFFPQKYLTRYTPETCFEEYIN